MLIAEMKLLFPFRGTFRRLRLRQFWWHRLIVVLFIASLVLSLLSIWVWGNREEAYGFYTCIASNNTLADKNRVQDCERLFQVHYMVNFGIAAAATVLLSYLLQGIYRVILYVAFGKLPVESSLVNRQL